ncbi:hypothetical protein EAH79_12285 [Sphingomonas koreensis]|nr:hypothetical protein EAH79_12285 [Sphingomonas koreensis]
MLLADFKRLPARIRVVALDGLSGLIDQVADGAPPSHRFLRFHWFATAIAASGGAARTILVLADGEPVIALPMTPVGPWWLRGAAVPGGGGLALFAARFEADDAAFAALLDGVGREARFLRIGPAEAGDHAVQPLLDRAAARGWGVLSRAVDEPAEDAAFWRDVRRDAVIAAALPGGAPALPAGRREWLIVRPGLTAPLARWWWRQTRR